MGEVVLPNEAGTYVAANRLTGELMRSKGLDHPFGWNCFIATWDVGFSMQASFSSRPRLAVVQSWVFENEEEEMGNRFSRQ